jgi:hypothetical protein
MIKSAAYAQRTSFCNEKVINEIMPDERCKVMIAIARTSEHDERGSCEFFLIIQYIFKIM